MPETPRPIPRLAAALIVAVLCLLPLRIYVRGYAPGHGFAGMLQFGREHLVTALPEVRDLAPPAPTPMGYDGQFYAQIALRPSLADPALGPALDDPAYRARRIGMPFLAHVLGLGRTSAVVQICAVLNAAFWLAFLALLLRCVGLRRPRDVILAASLLWTTGTLVSVGRALTDFPATALGAAAVIAGASLPVATALFAVSGLFRETSVLSAIALPQQGERIVSRRWAVAGVLSVVPVALWAAYALWRFPGGAPAVHGNFDLPFFGVVRKLREAADSLASIEPGASIGRRATLALELLAPLSLAAQVVYLSLRPRLDSAAWRFGVPFALLFCLLGPAVWVEAIAYSRVLLPLTFAFHLLVHEHERGWRYAAWTLAGSAGLTGGALQTFV